MQANLCQYAILHVARRCFPTCCSHVASDSAACKWYKQHTPETKLCCLMYSWATAPTVTLPANCCLHVNENSELLLKSLSKSYGSNSNISCCRQKDVRCNFGAKSLRTAPTCGTTTTHIFHLFLLTDTRNACNNPCTTVL